MPVSGNPQLNIRLERDLLDKVNQEAAKQGMKAQDWVRRLIKETLGEVDTAFVSAVDNTVHRQEFEALETLVGHLKVELDHIRAQLTVDDEPLDEPDDGSFAPREVVDWLQKHQGIVINVARLGGILPPEVTKHFVKSGKRRFKLIEQTNEDS